MTVDNIKLFLSRQDFVVNGIEFGFNVPDKIYLRLT